MNRVAPYSEYVEANARWLTRLPRGWDVTRVRYVCDVTTGSGDTVDAEPDGDFPFYVRSPQPLASTTYTFDGEAVLTAGDGAVGEVFHHVTGKFHAHQRVYVLHHFRGIDSRYFFHYFSALFRLMCTDGSARTTVDSVRRWMVTDMPVALPPLGEQRAIADFLDEQTSQIDALVAKQTQLIATLCERRILVRESLARNVGIGDRLKWLLAEVDQRAGSAASDLPLLSVSIDWGVRRRDSVTTDEAKADDLTRYKMCNSGDIVVNRMRAFQGALGVSPEAGIVSPDYAVLRTKSSSVRLDWLADVMRTKAFVSEMVLRIRGIGGIDSGSVRTPRINVTDLFDIRVATAPLAEQRSDLESTRARTSRIDALIAKTEQHIALARERRVALITAAVTGQIDVRTAGRMAEEVA